MTLGELFNGLAQHGLMQPLSHDPKVSQHREVVIEYIKGMPYVCLKDTYDLQGNVGYPLHEAVEIALGMLRAAMDTAQKERRAVICRLCGWKHEHGQPECRYASDGPVAVRYGWDGSGEPVNLAGPGKMVTIRKGSIPPADEFFRLAKVAAQNLREPDPYQLRFMARVFGEPKPSYQARGRALSRLAMLYGINRWPLEPDWLLRKRVNKVARPFRRKPV